MDIELAKKDSDDTYCIVLITVLKIHQKEYTRRLKHFFKANVREHT